MRGLGQIAELCEIALPEIGVITNVGPVHLELVESLAGVIRAKSELVAALPPGGVRDRARGFPGRARRHPRGQVGEPDAEVSDGRTSVGGVSFNFVAEHQAQNAAAALARSDALGLPRPNAVDVDFSRWRGEERELPGGGLLINDAYNANPVSMRAALGYLAARAGDRRRVAILGDMAELGRTAPGVPP
jgi:UDP-N-acetylmuramoyl-tripeptide--D-alanyl-D-alanine ligase